MRWIEVIETNRTRNIAYVAIIQDDPYWATNLEVKLDWVEELMRCKFEDGTHNFVTINFNGEVEYA